MYAIGSGTAKLALGRGLSVLMGLVTAPIIARLFPLSAAASAGGPPRAALSAYLLPHRVPKVRGVMVGTVDFSKSAVSRVSADAAGRP